MSDTRLPRESKGTRAQFFDDPAVDQLYAVMLELAAELSVAFDRIDTLERLLEQPEIITREQIEHHVPDEATRGERAARRDAYLARIFRVFGTDAPGTSGAMPRVRPGMPRVRPGMPPARPVS